MAADRPGSSPANERPDGGEPASTPPRPEGAAPPAMDAGELAAAARRQVEATLRRAMADAVAEGVARCVPLRGGGRFPFPARDTPLARLPSIRGAGLRD